MNLSEIVKKYSDNNLIIMGDFKAQVGKREIGEEFIMGKFGHGIRSKHGQKLIEFLLENHLTILNSVFKKHPKTKWTWASADSRFKNEIDYMITNKVKSFNDTHIVQNLNFNTDHRMVRSRLNMKTPKLKRKNIHPSTKILTEKQFRENGKPVSTFLIEIANSNLDIISKYNNLESTLAGMTKGVAKDAKVKHSDRTLDLIDQRRQLIASAKSKENRTKIAKLSKDIRESLRKDRTERRKHTLKSHRKNRW